MACFTPFIFLKRLQLFHAIDKIGSTGVQPGSSLLFQEFLTLSAQKNRRITFLTAGFVSARVSLLRRCQV
jgi:hypothetical protein